MINIPTSVGEVLDKISILILKVHNLTDPIKQITALIELMKLTQNCPKDMIRIEAESYHSSELSVWTKVFSKLYSINKALWDIEEEIRTDTTIIRKLELIKNVHYLNKERSKQKNLINKYRGDFTEIKDYSCQEQSHQEYL